MSGFSRTQQAFPDSGLSSSSSAKGSLTVVPRLPCATWCDDSRSLRLHLLGPCFPHPLVLRPFAP